MKSNDYDGALKHYERGLAFLEENPSHHWRNREQKLHHLLSSRIAGVKDFLLP